MVSHTSVSLEDSLSRLSHVGLSSATASRSQIIMRWLDFNGRIESQLSALTSAQHSKEMLRSRLEGTQLEIDCKRGIQDWTTCSQECLRWWAAGLVPKKICRCRYASSTAWKYDKCFHLQMCNPIIAGDDSFLVGLMMRQHSKTSICGQCWEKFKKCITKCCFTTCKLIPSVYCLDPWGSAYVRSNLVTWGSDRLFGMSERCQSLSLHHILQNSLAISGRDRVRPCHHIFLRLQRSQVIESFSSTLFTSMQRCLGIQSPN